jgi:glucose-6-phosphate-specific signal transduction histidine kinase
LLAVVVMAACLYVSVPEWQERARSRSLLLVPPVLAFICAYVMMGFVSPENREPWLLRSAMAIGAALGVARGFFLKADVDNYGLTRLPGARDGMPITLVIAAALAVAIVAPLVSAPASAWVPYATSVAALGATYLSGRAVVVYLRTRS